MAKPPKSNAFILGLGSRKLPRKTVMFTEFPPKKKKHRISSGIGVRLPLAVGVSLNRRVGKVNRALIKGDFVSYSEAAHRN